MTVLHSLSASIAALIVTLSPATVSAQWWYYMDRTPQRHWGTAMAPKIVYTREVLDQARLALAMFNSQGQYAKIDRMYEEFLSTQLRTTDGTWMLEAIQDHLDGLFSSSDDESVRKMYDNWRAAAPESKLRPLAEAIMWQRRAWNARGRAMHSDVPGESMRLFRERLGLAMKALEAAEPAGKESPLWYWVALIVAGSSGRPAAEFDALFEEAAARFPSYKPLYLTRLNYLLPQWGGNFDAVDQFIGRAVERTAATEGQSMYIWLYLDVARKYDGDIFTGTLLTWPKMKRAFEDMVVRYPDTWNKNLFATYACLARDRETTGRLLTELGSAAFLGIGTSGITTESCKRFAFSPA